MIIFRLQLSATSFSFPYHIASRFRPNPTIHCLMWRHSTSATADWEGSTSVSEIHGNMPDSGGCCAGGHLGGDEKLNFCGGNAVISGYNVWWIKIQSCIRRQSKVWSVEHRNCMATFDHWIYGKKKSTWKQLIQCWTFWKGGELLKYLGGEVRSKDCRMKKWRGN